VVVMIDTTLKLTRSAAEKLENEAQRLGLSLEEYILDLALRDLDPCDLAREYVEVAENLLEQAREKLSRGNIRQATEKVWGATALAVKAYVAWKDSKRLASHGELWEYSRELVRDLGEWVSDAWAQATAMHVCFYEGWCSKDHVSDALKRVSKLVLEVRRKIKNDRTP